jgi:hypothetical protein
MLEASEPVHAALLKLTEGISPSETALAVPSAVVVGFARSGKTKIAARISAEFGFSHISLDKVRRLIRSKSGDRDDWDMHWRFCEHVLDQHPCGVVIEGDNLIGENRSRKEIYDPSRLIWSVSHLRLRGAQVVFVGSADCTVSERADAITEYRLNNRCWTARYTDKQIVRFAERSISYSRHLRQLAEENSIPYFEIGVDSFEHDVSSVARHIGTSQTQSAPAVVEGSVY